jgi:hypothetical protein
VKTFREIETTASGLVCPDCGTCSLSVLLRCDFSDRECLTVASCHHCGRQFDAGLLPTYLEQYEALQRVAETEPCPACAGRQRTVRSLCDRAARQCHFLLACSACGDVRPA